MVRACRDAGLASVAVYAGPDAARRSPPWADEAVRWAGTPRADSYLSIGRLLAAAARPGPTRPPGYGFLLER